MDKNQIRISYRSETIGVRTLRIKYLAEIVHKGLNDYRVLSSSDQSILDNKVNSHVAKLNEKWEKVTHKENTVRSKEEVLRYADKRNREAHAALKEVEDILLYTLDIDDSVDWEQLKDKSRFMIPSPGEDLERIISAISKPQKALSLDYPNKPSQMTFQPKITFFDILFKSKKEAKLRLSEDLYQKALNDWKGTCENIDRENDRRTVKYEKDLLQYKAQVEKMTELNVQQVDEWSKKKSDFLKRKDDVNYQVTLLKENYFKKDVSAILEYSDLVLNNSEYPESFSKNFELDYNPETKILVVDYSLPTIEQLPAISEVKVVKGEAKEYFVSETQLQKMFDATMYKITLRTIHEIFEADVANAIEAVSFNGWINAINKATGNRGDNCILTIQARKNEFMQIDLRHVDPKVCFKNLKGVGSSKLSSLTPVQPILQINRNDTRFVNAYNVADSIDNSTNLASMDWEDFEHLIREVFGKEFNSNGGEVKVTKASRDGGVDAIAFDPDPIRGGKIVIQAKRYTNTVGVSSVRDLYGTVMNEGATKGILVTTADFGPDAYDFVKGKPLTLMNGSNLLYLLERHGHRAKIDIKEAKQNLRP